MVEWLFAEALAASDSEAQSPRAQNRTTAPDIDAAVARLRALRSVPRDVSASRTGT